MKRIGLLCIFLILVNFSTQIPKYENCPSHITTGAAFCDCCKVTCSAGGTQMIGTSCGVSHCAEGKQKGYHQEDNTKIFPDCCGHPICEE